jgi:hypothetical protein
MMAAFELPMINGKYVRCRYVDQTDAMASCSLSINGNLIRLSDRKIVPERESSSYQSIASNSTSAFYNDQTAAHLVRVVLP